MCQCSNFLQTYMGTKNIYLYSFFGGMMDEKVRITTELIKKQYLSDERPWVVGYSGGKDSTTVVQLIWNALLDMSDDQRKKPVYIVSVDTLVDNPMIVEYLDDNLNRMKESALKSKLPIEVHKLYPKPNERFWATLIGKGYPAPTQGFRWCTDRLKIKPTNEFIKNKVNEYGEVIVVLGVRMGESSSRNRSIMRKTVEGKILKINEYLPNSYIFAPIENWTTDEIWNFLKDNAKTPWGSDNEKLAQLYADSNSYGRGSDSPTMIGESSGNSRFGCWVCTVVREDKSLGGFLDSVRRNIENGIDTEYNKKLENILQGLIEFRNWLQENRNNENFREKKRQNGSKYYITKTDNKGSPIKKLGLGAYTFEARKDILRRLLILEKKLGIQLITKEELLEIRKEWKYRLGDFCDNVSKIYFEIKGEPLIEEDEDEHIMDEKDYELLCKLCSEENIDIQLFLKLMVLEKENYGFKYRSGIYKKIDSLLNQEWLHTED